jgi:single-strand DNA-binding protein
VIGRLSRDPERRELPSGDCVLTLDVSTRPVDGPSESVPVAWYDPPDRPALAAGDAVVVLGRTRRRFFRAGGATASRTEVVAERVEPLRRQARLETVMALVGERLADSVAAHRRPPRAGRGSRGSG